MDTVINVSSANVVSVRGSSPLFLSIEKSKLLAIDLGFVRFPKIAIISSTNNTIATAIIFFLLNCFKIYSY